MLQRVKAPSVGSLGESDRSRVSCQAGVGTEHQKEMSCYYAEPLRFHGCYPSSSPSSLIYLPRQEKIESRSKTWLVPIRTVRPMLWCCVQLGSPHELQAVWACTDQEAYSGKRGCLHLEPSSHLFSRHQFVTGSLEDIPPPLTLIEARRELRSSSTRPLDCEFHKGRTFSMAAPPVPRTLPGTVRDTGLRWLSVSVSHLSKF
ncbi:uncharacterized protein LOC105261378 isoform X2 [Felis catus]|uniref:uncharacterized protein LOC105261378 isoform X2 n=1 Tax=Felis catus TaxID=9685 RepID=UPI001D19BC78|nr:uncharacterized protein LOC105261378 isoform X2 [Felis catus]